MTGSYRKDVSGGREVDAEKTGKWGNVASGLQDDRSWGWQDDRMKCSEDANEQMEKI